MRNEKYKWVVMPKHGNKKVLVSVWAGRTKSKNAQLYAKQGVELTADEEGIVAALLMLPHGTEVAGLGGRRRIETFWPTDDAVFFGEVVSRSDEEVEETK